RIEERAEVEVDRAAVDVGRARHVVVAGDVRRAAGEADGARAADDRARVEVLRTADELQGRRRGNREGAGAGAAPVQAERSARDRRRAAVIEGEAARDRDQRGRAVARVAVDLLRERAGVGEADGATADVLEVVVGLDREGVPGAICDRGAVADVPLPARPGRVGVELQVPEVDGPAAAVRGQ